MNKPERLLRIVVEGKEDIRFLEDFIMCHFDIDLKDNKKIFLNMGGKDTWKKQQTSLQRIQSSSHTKLLVFDADSPEQDEDNGGFQNRLKWCKEKAQETSIEFNDIFLFPNNNDNGALEELLRSMAVIQEYFECWNNYESCLKSKKLLNFNLPDKHTMMYAYTETSIKPQKGEQVAGTKRTYFDKKRWDLEDLDNPYLKSLYDFLEPYIIELKSELS